MRPLSTPLMRSSVTDAQVQRVKPLAFVGDQCSGYLVHIIDSVNTKVHLSTQDIHRGMVHFPSILCLVENWFKNDLWYVIWAGIRHYGQIKEENKTLWAKKKEKKTLWARPSLTRLIYFSCNSIESLCSRKGL